MEKIIPGNCSSGLTCPSQQLRGLIEPVLELHEDRGRGQQAQHHRGGVNLAGDEIQLDLLECNHPAHHLRLAGALVVQGEAAGVVAEVPGPHGSDSQTELGAGALTVHAVDPAGLMDVNIVLGPGHLRRGD